MARSQAGDQSALLARAVLQAEGFLVEDIPALDAEKRADLRATFGDEEYVVEAKLRGPDRGWIELAKRAEAEGVAMISRRVAPWNALSSTIEDAHRQLQATPRSPVAFCVLWTVALHQDGEFAIDCVEKRLLGVESVVVVRQLDSLSTSQCFYYSSNDFERFPELDAAVVGTERGGRLLVNSFSPRRELLRKGRLYRAFESRGAVIDAELLEQQGAAFLIAKDFVGPRTGSSQWQYLKDRYGILVSAMVESQFNGLATFPGKPRNG